MIASVSSEVSPVDRRLRPRPRRRHRTVEREPRRSLPPPGDHHRSRHLPDLIHHRPHRPSMIHRPRRRRATRRVHDDDRDGDDDGRHPSRTRPTRIRVRPDGRTYHHPSVEESTEMTERRTVSASPSSSSSSLSSSLSRRRRLSDGELARDRDLGPGSSRRHGIVGDGEVDPSSTSSLAGTNPPEGTRTWIVYVLGGSYPEDHPILTTPSLFTDVRLSL